MASAIRYTGDNVREVSEFITPEPHSPYELKGGVWIKQYCDPIRYRLVVPARNGDVELAAGDYIVREDDKPGVARLNASQMRAEYPEYLNG